MPTVRNTVIMSDGTSSKRDMSYLPMPVLLPTEMPKTSAARAAVIENIKDDLEKPKSGRMNKAEMKKMARAAASERVRGLLDTKPNKKDVLEYMRCRIKELSD